ncbi:zinc ribbon domain-containing protein [Arthrobacter sp. GCM10027362]|uniref:zinc ribbon domain-containing protein n=1 Tax=Arthrobacter sp. GCM10027362 TaxID=3273379 RepID=UPI00364038D4
MRAYIANEVNRLLNRLSRQDIAGLVVEKLDFRGGGLGKRPNRLITRFGRAAVRRKLTALREDTGLGVSEVNPAYSSQECSGCHFMHRLNRASRDKFVCRFCGKRLDADINGARVLVPRRSWNAPGSAGAGSVRGSLRERLDGEFAARWGCAPPAPRAGGGGHRVVRACCPTPLHSAAPTACRACKCRVCQERPSTNQKLLASCWRRLGPGGLPGLQNR